MKGCECPHCGEIGISFIRKATLGPAFPAKCKVCGEKMTVKMLPLLLTSIPLLIPVIMANSTGYTPEIILAIITGLLATSSLTVRFVPLIAVETPMDEHH